MPPLVIFGKSHLELEVQGLLDAELFHRFGWVDFEGACALPRGNALLPQRSGQSTEGDRIPHLHECIPLALRLGLWHLKRIAVRRKAVEKIPQFLFCAACGDVSDHHLAGSKPLQAARVQAERLRPSAHSGASEEHAKYGTQVTPNLSRHCCAQDLSSMTMNPSHLLDKTGTKNHEKTLQ